MRIVFFLLCIILAALVCAVIGLVYLLAPPPILPFKRGGRIRGENDNGIRSIGSRHYYRHNGLPYPGCFRYPGVKRIDLNGCWEFTLDEQPLETSWKEISVPSCYNTANGPNTGHTGVSWYRRTFDTGPLPENGFFARLCLEGILLRGELWCNGVHIGGGESGYSPVYFDVSGVLKNGRNELVLRLDNRLTRTSLPPDQKKGHLPGWHTYGGIFRPVYIDILPEYYLFKIQLEYSEKEKTVSFFLLGHDPFGNKNIPVSADVTITDEKGSKRISCPLLKREDGIFLYGIQKAEFNAVSWSSVNPHLYTVSAALAGEKTTTVEQRIGFRSVSVSGTGLLVNGNPVFLRGIGKHEDHPDLGGSQTEELIEQDLGLIKELNANYIRMAHYQHDVNEITRAAELGLYVSEEIPLYQAGLGFVAWYNDKEGIQKFPWRTFGLRQLLQKKLLVNARDQLIRMIERDRNNPAVLFWSMGNECYSQGKTTGKVFGWLADIARMFDPDRPSTYVDVTYDMPVLDSWKEPWSGVDIYSQNSYYGWYYGTTEDLEQYLDRVCRKNPGHPVILSEFGGGALLGRRDTDGKWKTERVATDRTYSEDYQVQILSKYWETARRNPSIIGYSPWIFADFYNSWFPSNPIPNYNLKGIVTREREKKKSYYVLKELFRQVPE